MRKILSLLMLFCMFVGTTWAQTKVLDIASLTGEEELTFSTSGRGGWAVNADGTNFGSTNDHGFGTTVDYRNDQHVFQLKKNGGSLYLFSLYAQKYVNSDKSLSENATNAVTYVEQSDGTFVFKFSDTAIINIGGSNQISIDNWGSGAWLGSADKEYDVGNKITIMDVTEARLVKEVDVTYNYYINGKLYASQVETQEINSEVEVPAQAFLTVVDYQGTIGKENCEITVNCTENLPFAVTTDLSNPVWQVVEMHRYGTFRVWDYQANDNAVKVTDVADKENAVADNMLWCFTGNLIDGFKVYNKAAGTEVTLNATANNPMVGTASNGNDVWKLAKSTATNDPAACFTNNGSNYMNQNGGQIKYHSAADNGSTCYFYNPADFVLAEYASIETVPVGAVGSCILSEEMRASLQTANSAVEANPSDIEKVQALAELVKGAKSANKVSMSAGYYFVKATGGGNTAEWYLTHKVSDGQETLWAAAPSGGLNADYVWKFETAENGYKMLCTNLNAYYNIKTATNGGDNNTYVNIASAADAEELTLDDKGLAKFVIKNAGNENIRTEGNGQVNYWSGESNETWYIIPATAIDITIGEAGYATTYLPFDVTLPNEGLKAYAVSDVTMNGTEGSATLVEKTSIPANKGAILEGEKGTYTLKIAQAEAWDGNKLEGSNVNTYVEGEAYVLANGTEGVGFYKAAMNFAKNGEEPWAKVEENGTHFLNNANKAYLPAPTDAARFISFDFGTETAIESVESVENNVVVYDLAGRRVQGAQKGIFIVNGKKVVK